MIKKYKPVLIAVTFIALCILHFIIMDKAPASQGAATFI